MKGICLRGLAGWGDNLAPLTTVVNTMGGTWFDDNWNAQVNTGGFKTAANFYVNLLKQHGEAGRGDVQLPAVPGRVAAAARSRCGTTPPSAAGSLEASDSPVKGKIGYVSAPHDQTPQSGLALHLGLGDREGVQAPGRRGEVRRPGPPARPTSSWSPTTPPTRAPVARPTSRPASAPRPTPTRPTSRSRRRSPLRPWTPSRTPRPRNPGVAPAPLQRHPVRRHPVLHRLRHRLRQGLSPQPSPARPASTRP